MTSGGGSPVVRRRRLAAQLRRLRAESQRTLEEVADVLECSPAKISRIENGQVAVRIQDARELLDLYHVNGAEREELLDLVRQARRKGWWYPYADVMSEGMEMLLSLEDEASAIKIHETNLVTGLLQTADYAAALMQVVPDAQPDQVERLLELRMNRQRILARESRPSLSVVLDEAALRRQVDQPKVMVGQYEYLLEAAQHSHVTVQVLPFEAGPHQAMGFAFHLFEFGAGDPRIAYVKLLDRPQFLERAEDVGRYLAAFDQAAARALSPQQSVAFLARLVEETRR